MSSSFLNVLDESPPRPISPRPFLQHIDFANDEFTNDDHAFNQIHSSDSEHSSASSGTDLDQDSRSCHSLSMSKLDKQPISSQDDLARQSDVTVSNIHHSQAEYHGFTIYVLALISFIIYIAWLVIPDEILSGWFSISYYPDKYWAMAVPAYLLILMVMVYWVLALYNLEVLTVELSDLRCFVDEYTQFPKVEEDKIETHENQDRYKEMKVHIRDQEMRRNEEEKEEARRRRICEYIHKAPSGVWDLPITLVNEVLYLDNDEDLTTYNE